MRIAIKWAIAAVVGLAAASASAQPPDGIPPGAKVYVGESYTCPDPAVKSEEPVCCRITTTIDATGKATAAKAKCTHSAYEAPAEQCELGRMHEPRIRTGGVKEGYTRTFTQTHLTKRPDPFTPENMIAAGREADKRCELLDATG